MYGYHNKCCALDAEQLSCFRISVRDMRCPSLEIDIASHPTQIVSTVIAVCVQLRGMGVPRLSDCTLLGKMADVRIVPTSLMPSYSFTTDPNIQIRIAVLRVRKTAAVTNSRLA